MAPEVHALVAIIAEVDANNADELFDVEDVNFDSKIDREVGWLLAIAVTANRRAGPRAMRHAAEYVMGRRRTLLMPPSGRPLDR